jgi:hypothetical protein
VVIPFIARQKAEQDQKFKGILDKNQLPPDLLTSCVYCRRKLSPLPQ